MTFIILINAAKDSILRSDPEREIYDVKTKQKAPKNTSAT